MEGETAFLVSVHDFTSCWPLLLLLLLISSELREDGGVSGFCPSVLLCMVESELHVGSLSSCSAFSSESAVFVMQGCKGVQPCLTCAQNFVDSLNL